MRRLTGYLDASDVLCLLGAACIAVPIYVMWQIWVFAYIGFMLIVAGVLRDLGRGKDANGPRR